MKIKNFKAEGVHNHFNFDIKFNNDITFLIGVNGSGKTTILKLIYALLNPSIVDLMKINFSRVSIKCEEKKDKFEISAQKNKDGLFIRYKDQKQKPSELHITYNDFYLLLDNRANEEISENYQIRKYYREPIIEKISLIPSVIYLNIERTGKNLVELERRNLILRRNLRPHYPHNINSPSSKMVRIETLFEAIMEIQEMIRRQFFEMRNKELKFSDEMKKSMNLSLFRFENDIDRVFNDDKIKYLKNIIKSEREMLQALKEAYSGLSKEEVKSVKNFYSNIEQLKKSLPSRNNKKELTDEEIKLIINQQNIYQTEVFLELIHENKTKIKKLYSSIDKFKEIINFFYSDTGKTIDLDSFGEVEISYSNGKKIDDLNYLSSGEKHLLIIFAHLLFNKNKKERPNANIFIIDEPELSLHLKWQHNFVTKAIEADPNVQLIFATHSPEISGQYEDKFKEI